MLRYDNPQLPPLPKLERPEEILAAIQDFLAPVFAKFANDKFKCTDVLVGLGVLVARSQAFELEALRLRNQMAAAQVEIAHLETRLRLASSDLAARDSERERILSQALISSGRRTWSPPAREV